MEFLVRIHVALPTGMSEGDRERILAAELARGRDLVAAGKIKAIWRIPGALENVGIWEVEDATELHGLLESLPVYRWVSVGVTALAEHPLSSG